MNEWGIGSFWDTLLLSGNVTLSDSEISIDTQSVVEQTGVSAAITNPVRRLTGHSEWVVNMQLGYDSPDGNHSASMVYNVFGDRIIIAGIDDNDDTYEKPFHSLDLVYTYFPDYNSQVKLKLQNILNQEKQMEFENILRRSSTKGVGISLSYSREF